MISGRLVVIPTPVGNLEDITLRAIRELRSCDRIACEDTRRTRILLDRYAIRKSLFSLHRFNERSKVESIIKLLQNGETIALVSDAGTPGISDPGQRLISECANNGYDVDVLPGPTALIPALVMSGFETDSFVFFGFLPEKGTSRTKILAEIAECSRTCVIYISPHRCERDIMDIANVSLEGREGVIVREISKLFQERIRGSLTDLISLSASMKGEIVLVVEAAKLLPPDESEWMEKAINLLKEGRGVKEVAKIIHIGYSIKRSSVYSWLLKRQLKEELEEDADR